VVRRGSGSVRQERAQLRRDLERLTFARREGDRARAADLSTSILERAGRLGVELQATQAEAIGRAFMDAERVDDATHVFRSALEFLPPDTDASVITRLRNPLVAASAEAGRFAITLAEGDLLLRSPTMAHFPRAQLHTFMAEAERQLGRLEASLRHLDLAAYELSALQTTEHIAAKRAFVEALRGVLAQTAGDPVAADSHLRTALSTPELDGLRALVLALAGDVLCDLGVLETAGALLGEAAALAGGGRLALRGRVALVRARLARESGAPGDSLALLDEAEGTLSSSQRWPLVARVHRDRARSWTALGRVDEAADSLGRAHDAFVALGCALEVAAIEAEWSRSGRSAAPG